MKIKTSELIDKQLDLAVAMCEGLPIRYDPMNFGDTANGGFWIWSEPENFPSKYLRIGIEYCPSGNWAQGGPIVERERIEFQDLITEFSANYRTKGYQYGENQLIAAMRCYVAAKMGDEIELPEGSKST